MSPRREIEVRPGIVLIPVRTFTLPPATHTNCYLLGGEEIVIVDPGTPIPEEQEQLLDRIRQRLAAGARVREIWLTHHHKDHVGAAALVAAELEIPVAAHHATAAALPADVTIDRLIEDGEETVLSLSGGAAETWVALHTPGHARGHLCFFSPASGALLTGDNVVGEGTVLVAPPDGDMAVYMTSLQRLRALKPSSLLPAHGEPIAEADAKIAFYIAHRTEREDAILASLADGPLTPAEIVPRVYTDIDPKVYPLAELNVRTHLAKLIGEARIELAGERYRSVNVEDGV